VPGRAWAAEVVGSQAAGVVGNQVVGMVGNQAAGGDRRIAEGVCTQVAGREGMAVVVVGIHPAGSLWGSLG
jgi:hypothetical protein